MKIFYFVGKSGCGKDTMKSAMLKDKDIFCLPLIEATTRPKRIGEEDDKEHMFISPEEFNSMMNENKFIETRNYIVNDNEVWSYGTLIPEIFDKSIFIGSGSLISYKALKDKYGDKIVKPILLIVDNDERLIRCIHREGNNRKALLEICRRFISDDKDYSVNNITALGISRRDTIKNNGSIFETLSKVRAHILSETRYERLSK